MSELTKVLAPFDNQKDSADSKSPLPLKPCNMILCGGKGKGKTTLLLNLITRKESPWYKHFHLIFLISPTARRDDKLKELLEDIEDQYYDTLDNEVLTEICDRIDNFPWKKKKKKPSFLIIYDDCIHMLKGKRSSKINELATQNRHRNITNVYLLQKWNSFLPTLVRSNADCIAFWQTGNKKELDSFLEEQNDDEEKLMSLYKFATEEPYSFFFINQYHGKPRYYKRFDEIEWRPKSSDKK